LIGHFVSTFGRRHHRPGVRISEAAVARLKSYRFPGNIRELEHIIESAVVLCDHDTIEAGDLALVLRPAESPGVGVGVGVGVAAGAPLPGPIVGDPDLPLAELEREHVRRVVEALAGNQSEAARRLGIGRNTLARKLAGEPPSDAD
jgi:DNA-binding NtrC family response regulator